MSECKTKMRENIDFVQKLYDEGVEQIHKTRLPHPDKTMCLNRAHVPVLAITESGAVLIHENPHLRHWRVLK